MYSRYIPPAKGPSTASATASVPAELPDTTVQTQVGGPGFAYARYVPGAKASQPPIEKPTVQYFDDEPASTPSSKRKRSSADDSANPARDGENSKKKVKGSGNDSNRHAAQDKRPSIDAAVETESAETPTKEKKKKKKKSKTKANETSDLKVAEHAPDDQSQPQDEVVEDNQEVKESKEEKTKKKKKEKRKGRNDEEPTPEHASNGQDVTMVDSGDVTKPAEDEATAAASVKPSKEEKEKKREKRKEKQRKAKGEQPQDDEATGQEDDHRHKMIMERKTKSLRLADAAPKEDASAVEPEEPQEVHELGPLPQPVLAPFVTPQIQYETLPSWLASPIRVSQGTRTPFAQLGVSTKAARVLEEKGYPDAFAVQTAVLPRLIPSGNHRPGDLLISAATGSGKTLAYALPIVRDLSDGVVTRLRALVVLPTRELVKQAQEVFEVCVKAYEGGTRKRVRVGVAIGNQTMKSEQDSLIEKESRYDPVAYQKIKSDTSSVSGADHWLGANGSDPQLGDWEGEVVDFSSKVDILICTPGRLVEHIEQSPGFSLDYVRWLVVDEADKLLAQSFQGWLEVVLECFKSSKWTAREAPDVDLDGVRKVILSATLTRDLSLLNQLALRRPELVILENDGDLQMSEHALPSELEEFAIRVHDINLKPLYLLDLLRSHHMTGQEPVPEDAKAIDSDATSDTSSEGSSDTSDSESESESGSDSDTSSSGSDSDSDSDSDTSSSGSDSESDEKPTKTPVKISKANANLPTALIFTKSNEAALRLSRLLTLLDKTLSPHISTITSTTPTHIRRKTLRAFTTPSSPVRLIIASDLVARGIDLPNLDHVVNYDLPPSVAAYVHRVGRTARAGRSGRAWTLVGDEESGWFWGKIAKGTSVRRPKKVERIRIDEMGEDRVHIYEAALQKLGQEALDTRRK